MTLISKIKLKVYIYILILLKSGGHTHVKFISYNVDLIQMIGYITVVYKEVYIKMQSGVIYLRDILLY